VGKPRGRERPAVASAGLFASAVAFVSVTVGLPACVSVGLLASPSVGFGGGCVCLRLEKNGREEWLNLSTCAPVFLSGYWRTLNNGLTDRRTDGRTDRRTDRRIGGG